MNDSIIEAKIKIIEELKSYTYKGGGNDNFYKKYENVPLEKLLEELNLYRQLYRDQRKAAPPGVINKLKL